MDMKLARELFEELGYKYGKYSYGIYYLKDTGSFIYQIWFNKFLKKYMTRVDDRTSTEPEEPNFVDAKTLKAIYKQFEELGWLDD